MDEVDEFKWWCRKCGGRLELGTSRGRTSAKYGMCPKCLSEKIIDDYKKAKFGLFKITAAIPFLVVWLMHRHFYGKNRRLGNDRK